MWKKIILKKPSIIALYGDHCRIKAHALWMGRQKAQKIGPISASRMGKCQIIFVAWSKHQFIASYSIIVALIHMNIYYSKNCCDRSLIVTVLTYNYWSKSTVKCWWEIPYCDTSAIPQQCKNQGQIFFLTWRFRSLLFSWFRSSPALQNHNKQRRNSLSEKKDLALVRM